MNVVLWILQILLAVHTFAGAVWKFSNTERAVRSLNAIPHSLWLTLGVVEILCSIALLVPALNKRLAAIAAIFVGVEMLFFCAVHLRSGDPSYGPMIYWLVVAAISAFIAWGRLVRRT